MRVNEENFATGDKEDVEPSYVEQVVGNHNQNEEAHPDVRELISRTQAFYKSVQDSVSGVAEVAVTARTAAESAAGKAEELKCDAEEAKKNAEAAVVAAEFASKRYPYIGANGNWFTWNIGSGKHIDTGVPAKADIPEKGADYWTPEDIAEIKSYVDDAILGGEW